MKAILDVIKFEGDNHQLVWKHPAEDFNTSSTLIVREGQVALFYKNGQVSEVYEAGRHVLKTQNIPFLRNILQLPTGGESTFSCQVYFVNLVEAMNINWGLASRAKWVDPVLGIRVDVGVRGTLSIKVLNPESVVVGLVGAETDLSAEALTKYFRSIINMKTQSYLANYAISENIDVDTLASRVEETAMAVKEKLEGDFVKYGFKLCMFGIDEISLPESDPAYMRAQNLRMEKGIGLQEHQLNLTKSTMSAKTAAENEAWRGQGEAARYAALGTNYVTDRQLDIAEKMAGNESMNQFSGLAGSMAMMGGAMNMGVQTASAIGNIMNPALNSMNNMNPIGTQPAMQQPVVQPQMAPQSAVQAQAAATKICISCGATIPAESSFCMKCGNPQPKICFNCGTVLPEGAAFCMKCGTKVE